MLGSRDHVKPHRLGNLNVPLSLRVGVQKRRALLPIFRRSIDLHDQRVEAVTAQQCAGFSRQWIGELAVRERKMIFWKVMILVLRVGAIGLAELRVGEDSTDPGDVDEQGVEDLSFVLVLIEAQIDVIAQIAAALRKAVGVSCEDSRRLIARRQRIGVSRVVVLAVAQERNQISGRRVTDSKHLGVFCRIAKIVDDARLELRAFRQQFDSSRIGIGPATGWNLRRSVQFLCSYR